MNWPGPISGFTERREGREERKERTTSRQPSPQAERERGKAFWRRERFGESAPPVAAENRDDDDDCDEYAGEDNEELKDLRGVHNCHKRSSKRERKRRGVLMEDLDLRF